MKCNHASRCAVCAETEQRIAREWQDSILRHEEKRDEEARMRDALERRAEAAESALAAARNLHEAGRFPDDMRDDPMRARYIAAARAFALNKLPSLPTPPGWATQAPRPAEGDAFWRRRPMTTDEAIGLINAALCVSAGVTFKGDEVKLWVPDTDDGGIHKTYLTAADCRDLADAFASLATTLGAGEAPRPAAGDSSKR